MKTPFHLLLLASLLCGCHNGTGGQDTAQDATGREDSLSLHVALMPTMDCLPFYYADHCGLFKESGLEVTLLTYNAQMDCDTAFERNHADVCYTDLIRAAWMQSKGTGLYAFMQADGAHELLAAKGKRIKQIEHLEERMVAMARHSVTDLLLDTVIGQALLEPSAVYHPQINDITLRLSMLNNATIDAAFLPEPYASMARHKGHKSIYSSRKPPILLMAFMVSAQALADSTKARQVSLLLEGYNKAVAQINGRVQPDSIRNTLAACYPPGVSTEDSLKIPEYKPAEKPKADNVALALRFLAGRELIGSAYNGDTLIHPSLIP